jgi:uncharacterized protein (DUF305 family)
MAALLATALVAGAVIAGCGSSSSSGGASSRSAARANAVDRAFVRQMIPHHQMAVEMAQVAKRESLHGRITEVASAIVTAQTGEIGELKRLARQVGVKPAAMPMGGDHMDHMGGGMMEDARAMGLSMDAMGMSTDMGSLDGARPFDRAFIDMMIPHHQGAIRMARAELAKGDDPTLKQLARGIVAAQTKEINEMNSWRRQWYGSPSPAGGVPQA